MIEPYSEASPSNPLPKWATLTQVSEATGVSRSAVRSAARRALKQKEPWVKKADGKILLDTHHDTYKTHARRWEDDAWSTLFQGDEETMDVEATEENAEFAIDDTQDTFYWYPSLSTEGYKQWPLFCQWLATQGLCVSLNLLADKDTLHWTWGELHGEVSNPSVRDAVIAALEQKLHLVSSPEPTSSLPSASSTLSESSLPTPGSLSEPSLPSAPSSPSSSEQPQHFWSFKRSRITKVIR